MGVVQGRSLVQNGEGANDDPSFFCILSSRRCRKSTNYRVFAHAKINYSVDQVHFRTE